LSKADAVPLVGWIVDIQPEGTVNVSGYSREGNAFGATHVTVLQSGQKPEEGKAYCVYAPYDAESHISQPTLPPTQTG
jgi:hypothetical protein